MSTNTHRILPGLLALHRRKLGLPRLPGDDAAVAALDEATRQRCRRVFRGGLASVPEADRDDIAQSVMLRLVGAPETVLDAVAAHFAPKARLDGLGPEDDATAERIASGYVTKMLHNLAVEQLRRRGHSAANPMAVSDVDGALDALVDPLDFEEAVESAQRRDFAEHSRRQLDEVARHVAATRLLKDLGASYDQLWRLADEHTTVEDLVRETGVSEAALHQRHSRVRKSLLDGIHDAARRGVLAPPSVVVLSGIVTVYLRRRQIREAAPVSYVMASSKDPVR